MNEKEILEKADEKVGENVYRANGDYFTQYQGELMNVREIDDETLKTICEYDAIPDESDERQEELTVEEVQHVEEDEEPVRGTETGQIVEVDGQEYQGGLIQPADDIEKVADLYEKYDEIKSRIISDEDKQTINTKHGKETFTTKSGWRKIATAFSISDKIANKEREELENGGVKWTVEVVAQAPNGRKSHGIAMCSSDEYSYDKKEHDILATAHTRAKNRAVSDFLGGEPSAEEMR